MKAGDRLHQIVAQLKAVHSMFSLRYLALSVRYEVHSLFRGRYELYDRVFGGGDGYLICMSFFQETDRDQSDRI